MKRTLTFVQENGQGLIVSLVIFCVLVFIADTIFYRYSLSRCTQHTVDRLKESKPNNVGVSYRLMLKTCMGKRGYLTN